MQLGEKLRQARQQAGLSQRQLCGDVITRNMLSQIENGSASPSMTTMRHLAGRLGLPVSYFLEEEGSVSTNQTCMESAWRAFENSAPETAYQHLQAYQSPDPVYDREYRILKSMVLLQLAEESVRSDRAIYARQLLAEAEELEMKQPWLPELHNRRMELLAQLGEQIPEGQLPELEPQLFLHARSALSSGQPARAVALLEACSDWEGADWYLLRGKAAFALREYGTAAKCFVKAEEQYPKEIIPLLEECYRETGDYKMAYEYACKARKL